MMMVWFLPPKIAPVHVVIVPLLHQAKDEQELLNYCKALQERLENTTYNGAPVKVKLDLQEKRAGDKVWGWIKKGVPIRLEVGPKELENNAVFMGRRDLTPKDKCAVPVDEFTSNLSETLTQIQDNLFARALAHQQETP